MVFPCRDQDLPPEGDEAAEAQHQELLQRLFGAAYEIQQLQNEAQARRVEGEREVGDVGDDRYIYIYT